MIIYIHIKHIHNNILTMKKQFNSGFEKIMFYRIKKGLKIVNSLIVLVHIMNI